jgi:hypothetical protein
VGFQDSLKNHDPLDPTGRAALCGPLFVWRLSHMTVSENVEYGFMIRSGIAGILYPGLLIFARPRRCQRACISL